MIVVCYCFVWARKVLSIRQHITSNSFNFLSIPADWASNSSCCSLGAVTSSAAAATQLNLYWGFGGISKLGVAGIVLALFSTEEHPSNFPCHSALRVPCWFGPCTSSRQQQHAAVGLIPAALKQQLILVAAASRAPPSPGRGSSPASSPAGPGHPRAPPEPPLLPAASSGQPRPSRLEFCVHASLRPRRPPVGPATSGNPARASPAVPRAAGRRWSFLWPPRHVRAEVGPAQLPGVAAAYRGVHRLPLGLRRRTVAAPTSSGRRYAAGKPEPER
ncbi:hypothetical protein ACMD2_16416 [Ananas comosus]|uniref:Uncharacterized protein n=1 Tax=Ananas comosus TaxID=4615 RepID=A0A199VH65_ANACO|nr:hypothetical protein ACMD2_16416 [Ananas comosus]